MRWSGAKWHGWELRQPRTQKPPLVVGTWNVISLVWEVERYSQAHLHAQFWLWRPAHREGLDPPFFWDWFRDHMITFHLFADDDLMLASSCQEPPVCICGLQWSVKRPSLKWRSYSVQVLAH